MAFHEKVYSPEGEMFEVPASRIPYLVLQKGWTRSRPELVDPPKAEDQEEQKKTKKSSKRSSTADQPAETFNEIEQDFQTESDS